MLIPSVVKPRVPRDYYALRADELRYASGEEIKLQGSYRVGLIFVIFAGFFMLYQSLVAKRFPLWAALSVAPVVAYFGRQSKRHREKAQRFIRQAEHYDRGIARIDLNWEALDEGNDFADPDHFYAADLDLFGRGSLFQLLSSARTQVGRATLADWMKKTASKEEVLARHAAISELRERHDLREALASAGTFEASNCQPETFRKWIVPSSPSFPFWVRPLAFMLVFALILLPTLYGSKVISLQAFERSMEAVVLAELSIGVTFLQRVRQISESVNSFSVELPIVCEILHIAERERFTSPKLIALADRAKEGMAPIRRLQRLVRLLKVRNDPFFSYFSNLLMWGTQFSIAIEQWRVRFGPRMLEWLSVLGELEGMISLSAYAYEHPLDIFPELSTAGPTMVAEKLGHPLLHEDTCVRNDFQLGGDAQFLIVSGSNMSGKSTFLRAIGLNAVLAWMGAPVRCSKLSVSALEIGASVRVQDSVVDGRSHFLAEMQRLRRMIDAASETPLLYLADEIMGGTNSHDRRIATEWVVRALLLRHAIGVITTHDLALTEIASNGLPGRNVYFEDSGEAGSLTFDYKLRPGLLTRSNALNIAHMLGIDAAASSAPITENG
jgi:hypothetical protein